MSEKPLHGFRAYRATSMRDMGANATDIADQLGATMATAQRYTRKTNAQIGHTASFLNKGDEEAKKKKRGAKPKLHSI